MNADPSQAWFRAGEEAATLPIDGIVTRLRVTIGIGLVAYIGGATTTSAVSDWADGRAVPNGDADKRLRTAFHSLGILLERWGAVTIQSWFKGMNPTLGDEAPARVIRESTPAGANNVIVAACSAMIN